MINNQDAGDVSGLEEVFRSQEFGRASGTAADGSAGIGVSVRRGEGILGMRFGRRPVAAPVVRSGDDAGSTRARLRSGRRRSRPPVRAPYPGGGPPPILLRGDDTPAGTGRLPRSARSSRSSRQGSRRAQVNIRGRISPPKDDMGGPGPVVASTPQVRHQRAWPLQVACSRTRPAPPALRRSQARRAGLVRATRPVDMSPLLGRPPSPELPVRPRRRRVALRAGVVRVAELRARRRPRAPIRPLPSCPPSGAR